MRITVEVVSYKGASPLERLTASFDQQGGTLGRSPDNHLILSDPQNLISRQHAIIRYENGGFHLQDTSMTGTFVCNKNLRVHQNSVQLEDGDELKIGDYELIVAVPDDPGPDKPSSSDTVWSSSAHAPPAIDSLAPPVPDIPPEAHVEDIFDAQADEKLAHGPGPETPDASGSPPRQECRDRAYDELCKVFLEAAGIDDTSFYRSEEVPDLMRTAGALFRETIDGLVSMLQGRAELKSQLRASLTILEAVHNNPLKFSPILEETLKLLLTKSHPGFIDGVEAVREGYEDLRNHQLAMTAGVQAAVTQLLERFAPRRFAKRRATGIAFRRKGKYWEAYSRAYQNLAAEALEDFFGEAFVRAYEEQMWKLRSRANKP